MKKIFYICFWTIVIISCRKNNALPLPVADVVDTARIDFEFEKHISTIHYASPHGLVSEKYAYDDHGRIAFYQTEDCVETFIYPSENELRVIRRDESTQKKYGEWKAEINEHDAISTLCYYNNDGKAISREDFSYNDKGYMINHKFIDLVNSQGSFEEEYMIENGFLKKTTRFIWDEAVTKTIYTSATGRTAHMLQTPHAKWLSKELFGKPLAKMPAGATMTNANNGKLANEETYDYYADDEGYVVGQIINNKTHKRITKKTIAY